MYGFQLFIHVARFVVTVTVSYTRLSGVGYACITDDYIRSVPIQFSPIYFAQEYYEYYKSRKNNSKEDQQG